MKTSPEKQDAELWRKSMEAQIASLRSGGACPIDRVMIVDSTPSTQDVAREEALAAGRGHGNGGARGGCVVIALRQTGGRGRLGRIWADTAELGLAVTFSLDVGSAESAELSMAAGLASVRACEDCLDSAALGLRWPNDVVERSGAGRKLSGVLIEVSGPPSRGVALVGIGINVLQGEEDFPGAIAGRAVSLAMLGSRATRLWVAGRLLVQLVEALGEEASARARAWVERDVLVGQRRTFEHANQRHTGVVERIDPSSTIVLRMDNGQEVALPSLTTSLIHDS